jgi:hypothetical protein
MKLLHYFLGFNAAVLSHFFFNDVLNAPDILITYYIYNCLAFSALATIAVYNLVQGYKLQYKS